MEEKSSSYSIYIDKRPQRQIYIFNKTTITHENIDQIFKYNMKKWGGRYNYVLIANKNKISEDQWKFIRLYDPDFVKLCINPSIETLLDFDRKATPLQVSDGRKQRSFSPRMEHQGLSIIPSSLNIKKAGKTDKPYIVLFNIDNCEDSQIKRFIELNFGILDSSEFSNQSLFSHPNKVEISITDEQSFIDAISSFNDFKSYVFPMQLSSLGDSIPQIDLAETTDDQNNFYVFIGNSTNDLIDFWNNPMNLQDWSRTSFRQIWLPTSLIQNPDLIGGIKKLLSGRADPYGTGSKKIIFKTSSLNETKINKFAQILTEGTYNYKSIEIANHQKCPKLSNFFSFSRMKQNMDHIEASGKEKKVILKQPDIAEGVMGGEYWMNDFYIEVPEKKVIPVNFDTWLQLPKNNSITRTVIDGLPARINSNGLPSVLSSRSNRFHGDTQEVKVSLPKTWSIFESIIMNVSKHYFTNDLRARHSKSYEYIPEISSDGKHIHGFLEAFGSLEGAYQVFEEKHWRTFFDLMSNNTEKKEENKLSKIKSSLKKKISAMPSNPINTDFIDWLSDEILKNAIEYSQSQPKSVSFADLESIVLEDLNNYNDHNPSSMIEYSKKDVVKSLKRLTDSGVINIGYELRCSSCLNKDWRLLNDIDQFVECRGCGYQFSFPPETQVRYMLNGLIENGIRAKGVVPTILALGSIFRDANHYFDFIPPVNILKNGKLLTDLDICCIVDGDFIIGEIKANHKRLRPSDCEKITNIAKQIRPDKVIFSSMNPKEKITKNTKLKIKKVSDELEPLGIKVEWLYLDPHIFLPQPIY